jgi:hypothetical protein
MNIYGELSEGSAGEDKGKGKDTEGSKWWKNATHVHMQTAHWNPPNTLKTGGGGKEEWKYNERCELYSG